ncbi:type I phosphomannose isomerase catalytic subunit [Enorma massiliensis]|uniref:type I phosphomannose isomerase catalytic subunit n=1 Tax=Enorma massiliensis TaxID=1472761 RepID=UPI00320AF82C
MEPLKFSPTYVHPIWAGDAIAKARGLPTDTEHNYGEAFDVSAHPDACVTIANGPLAGMHLDDAISAHHDDIIGTLPDHDVIQITFMDARETLSIQVHPNEEQAQRLDGDHEKTESWYILHAEPGATLIGGSTTTDLDALRAAAADDSIGERFGKRIAVSEGDFVFVPAGTMHALGAGIFAVEVGSFGNRTYRMCDWGRGRELHVDKAFEVVNTESTATVRHFGSYGHDEAGDAALPRIREGVRCGLFVSNVIDIDKDYETEPDGVYHIITCVQGSCTVESPEGAVGLACTESALVPASAGRYTVRGTCRVLQSYHPR